MGCDIHTFLEYTTWDDNEGDPYWLCFGGQINTGRNYSMFGLLAGVRGGDAMFDPRGLPDGKLSYQVDEYMRCRIADEGTEPADGEVSLETARSWTAGHYGETIIELNGKPRWVTNPDLHSHSWLTLDELKQVLVTYVLGDKANILDVVADEDRQVATQAFTALRGIDRNYDPSWDALVSAMGAIESRGGKTRLIFCFDN